jgi:hypothetical protein
MYTGGIVQPITGCVGRYNFENIGSRVNIGVGGSSDVFL